MASSHSAYEMVEDDDYEEYQVPRLNVHTKDAEAITPPLAQDEDFADVDRTPMRSASISRDLPLNHPVSLQGARERNVARLEESAKRLSMSSSLEEELQKMKQEQRRLERKSSNSTSSSIRRRNSPRYPGDPTVGVINATRLSGYSPGGHITSPVVPSRRARGFSQLSDKSQLQRVRLPVSQLFDLGFSHRNLNLDFSPSSDFNSAPRPPPHAHQLGVVTRQSILQQGKPPRIDEESQDRLETRGSTDTSREAKDLFADFDGAYYGAQTKENSSRRISLTRPLWLVMALLMMNPNLAKKMVYYPAPVPMMLNLPQRLSNMQGVNDRERRRLQALSAVPPEMRNAAPWLKEQEEARLNATRGTQTAENLPPQLRASAFFDRPSAQQDIKLVNSSAVDTLDSLLNASAHAPVSAFTDHPIAGHLGREVYGTSRNKQSNDLKLKEKSKNAKRRSSLSKVSKMGKTDGTDAVDEDGNVIQASDDLDGSDLIAPSDEEIDENDDEQEEEDDHRAYLGPPTTLLAELQMRKAEQKSRNRTAADTFPNGMHSTLLELDAVTQLQQKSRKLKHVTLAWEDHQEADRLNFEDEDVPLGILFQGKKAAAMDANRPMGLMEKRDMEDNEPLSSRRARLRGEALPSQVPASVRQDNQSAFYSLGNPNDSRVNVAEEEDEHEGETLGQRKARLASEKAEKEADTGADFAQEVASQLGLPESEVPAPSKTPEVEETLAQRKKRLQQQRPVNDRQLSGQSLKSRHSLADLLQAHPAAGAGKSAPTGAMGARPNFYPSQSYSSQAPQAAIGAFIPTSFPHIPPTYMNPLYNPTIGVQVSGVYGASQFVLQDPGMGPPLDPKQRDQIDRWRQGIVQ